MFADDTTLIAKSKAALQGMIRDIRTALGDVGLNMNPDKCSIQTSSNRSRAEFLVVEGQQFKVVRNNVGFKVLGAIVTLNGNSDAELKARIAAGWAKFHQLRPLLCKKGADINNILRLFDSTVSNTVLWCCGSWALTVKQKKMLKAVRRSMLRRMVGPPKMPDEDYITWIRRVTHMAEVTAEQAEISCWQTQSFAAKWQWAAKLVRTDQARWASRTTFWRDSTWTALHRAGSQAYGSRPLRARPGNRRRWEDDLRRFAEFMEWEDWQTIALTDVWDQQKDAFTAWGAR